MTNPDIYYLHALNLLPRLGSKRLRILTEQCKTFKDAFFADAHTLAQAGCNEACIELVSRHRAKINIEKEIADLEKENILLLSYNDESYPLLLREISDAPPLLYYKGVLRDPDELMIAVVGTRKISTYGRTITSEFVAPLGTAGVTIVSGLALGIDALAHQTCVDNNFRTVAVIGSGLDDASIYPRQHQYLAEQILEKGGMLMSEYPIGTPAYKQNFIARNRIISGLSAGTLVVEANGKSGALITARHALDQNRSVYAVPGAIYSAGSEGPHNLIRMGAELVTKPEHILEDLRIDSKTSTKHIQLQNLNPDEQALVRVLTREPADADDIMRRSGLEASVAMATLTYLEMKGYIKNVGGNQYVLLGEIEK